MLIKPEFEFNDDEESKEENIGAFMATSDLIDLFTNEGRYKDDPSIVSSKEKTLTLFSKNPFKDFTTSKITEVLTNKNYDQLQEIRKSMIDYRASVERKLLSKLQDKESPTVLNAKRIDIEKWVDRELKEVEGDENSEENTRQKAIKII